MIESVNNERIKEIAKLKEKKYRDTFSKFIVEGEHLVEEALKAGIVLEVFSLDDRENATKVSTSVMNKLTELKTPPKVLAVCKKLEERDIKGNILILDNIQDPGNLGTIIRSSIAFGIDTIVASKETVDIYNMKTIRATEGMLFKINYLKRDLISFLNELDDYDIITTNVNTGTELNDLEITNKYALIMGNEGAGVRSEIANLANKTVNIKMNNECESLNVGVATSIILYKLYTSARGN